jgi:hypothetical protein
MLNRERCCGQRLQDPIHWPRRVLGNHLSYICGSKHTIEQPTYDSRPYLSPSGIIGAVTMPGSVRIEDRLIGGDGLADGVQLRACWLVGIFRRRQAAKLQ